MKKREATAKLREITAMCDNMFADMQDDAPLWLVVELGEIYCQLDEAYTHLRDAERRKRGSL